MSSRVSSVLRPGLFAGQVAIVTGGGTGIGKAITRELLYLGCNVMIAARNLERLNKTAEEIRAELPSQGAPTLETIQCNIRKEPEVVNLIATTLEKFKRIDYLINNSGGQFVSPASKFRLKGWNAVIETNLTGTYLMCREAYNQWMEKNGGVIVNMVVNMWLGWPGAAHSGASRAGIVNLTKSLAIEWAQSGVRINCVAPGSSIFSDTAAANYGEYDLFKSNIPSIPFKRLGNPEEVSGVICFLLSPASAFISGETVKIDGAQSLYSPSTVYEIPDHKNMPAYDWNKDAEIVERQKREQAVKSKL